MVPNVNASVMGPFESSHQHGPARPLASRPGWPSGCTRPWAPRMSVISWRPLLRPARLRAYASTTPLPRPPPGSLPVWVGSPLTGRVSHPLDDKRSFMMSSHHHSPLTSPCLVAPCTNACAGKARSRGTRCRDVIFETLFETLWVSNPIRPRSAASRNRVMRGPGVTQGAKRSQGARRPRD